jgi:probable selenium-dependent hydroxylase accessory protein YqeC
VIAFVGAGGKTTALFQLARELESRGRPVLITTTTHVLDPRRETGRAAMRVLFRPEMETPCPGASAFDPGPGVTLLVSREAGEPGKLKGVHSSWVPALRRTRDFVLVEADGSRRLPMKAPGLHEPAIPPGTDLVVGVVGLDGLGMPMDEQTVHRPERFAEVTGCAPGAPIAWEHIAALVRHPEGLFKGSYGARRVVLLNKADAAPALPSGDELSALAADLVLLCRLEGDPSVTLFGKGAGTPCR